MLLVFFPLLTIILGSLLCVKWLLNLLPLVALSLRWVCVCVCMQVVIFFSFVFIRSFRLSLPMDFSFILFSSHDIKRASRQAKWMSVSWVLALTLEDSYRRRRELKMQWTSDTQLLLILNMFAFLLDFPRFFSPRRLLALLAHRCCSFALHWDIMTAAMPSVSATEWQ